MLTVVCICSLFLRRKEDECRKDAAEDGEEGEVVGEGWVQGM